jgi:transcriptional regulator with XRE-family HTH domain
MVPSIEVRREAFAIWVRRVTGHAKTARGLSIEDIAELAGIGNPTIYRWRKGQGKALPLAEQVEAFCDALDIDPAIPFAILWPGKNRGSAAAEPLPLDPDFQTLARKILDPNTSDFEKKFIRETMRQLADRPADAGRVLPRRTTRDGGVKS